MHWLNDFFETVIHTLLYVRQIYPQNLFQKRKKYHVPVYMSRHPELNQYVLSILLALEPWLHDSKLRKLVLVVLDQDTNTPIEKFVFQIHG
ncbi:DNA-binding protein [Rozella allomycis CSF55]|uniref:DNA-binding protein n=1 Tax=Rozella allomycis (strain CSF55) TaxID=988480 RepID=A0A4P9YCH2_ROZAC|nr:DNA-binding protein [Rozella allomycis CSF55]